MSKVYSSLNKVGGKRVRAPFSKQKGRKAGKVSTWRRARSLPMGPLGTQVKTKFLYSDSFNLDIGAAGITAVYDFSCNGLYDPNITGVGHQPRAFDQLMALYDHYVVIGAKIILTCHNSDTGNGAIVGVYVEDDNTAVSAASEPLESRIISYVPIAPEGSGPNCVQCELALNPNQFLGRSKPLADPELKGSATSNPTEQAFFRCFAIPGPAGTDNTAIYCNVRIEYTAILIEPKTLGQS